MFKFIQFTPTGRDCCAGYEIRLDREYTVSEFIETVLKGRANEWGNIVVKKKGEILRLTQCEYRFGKITTEPLLEQILSKHINNVSASGGWTRMDYVIEPRE